MDFTIGSCIRDILLRKSPAVAYNRQSSMNNPPFEDIQLSSQSLQQSTFNASNPTVIVANGFLR